MVVGRALPVVRTARVQRGRDRRRLNKDNILIHPHTSRLWTSSCQTRRGPWARAGGPRRRRPHPTSAIDEMRTGISSVTVPNKCKKNRPKLRKPKWNNKRSGGGGSPQPKWCSYLNTNTHSNAECQKQQSLCTNKQKELHGLVANLALLHSAGQANLPNIGSAHLAQSTPATAPQAPAEPTSFGFSSSAQQAPPAAATLSSAFFQTPPAASADNPAAPLSISSESTAKDHRLRSVFFGVIMATPAEMSLAPFRLDGSCIRMVVNSEATDKYLEPALSPGVRAHMCDVEDVQVSQTIVAAGRHLLKGVTTRTIRGAVMDDNRNDWSLFGSFWCQTWKPTYFP